MAHNKFARHTVLKIDGLNYVYRGHMLGKLQIVNPVTGAPFVMTDAKGVTGPIDDAQFAALLAEERVEIRSTAAHRRHALEQASHWTIAQAMAIDPGVEKMCVQLDMLDDAKIPKGEKAIAAFMKDHWTDELKERFGEHDKPSTLRNWMATRGSPGKRHPAAMIRWTGKAERKPHSAEPVAEIMAKHLLDTASSDTTCVDGYAAMCAELIMVNEGRHAEFTKPTTAYRTPSISTWRRRIKLYRQAETEAAAWGKAATYQNWQGAGRPLTADFAGQRVIIDHTRLDCFAKIVFDDGREIILGRPWLTLAIDVFSRAILAHLITFISPCSWTVAEIVKRMALAKRPPPEMAARYPELVDLRTKPVELVLDNAVEFRAAPMQRAARAAGFSVRFGKVKASRYQGIVERANGTMNRLICANVKGRTIPPAEAKRIGYDPQKHVVAEMNDIEAWGNMGCAIYNTNPHPAIEERPPALVFWREIERDGIVNFADLDAFQRDLMVVATGTLRRSGLVAFGNQRFIGTEQVLELLNDLAPLEKGRARREPVATVEYLYNPLDISRIWIWNHRRRDYVELRSADERYSDGMALFVHEALRDAARAEGAAFNTEQERLAVRDRYLRSKRGVAAGDPLKRREELATLLEVPRIRQITGNLVRLSTAEAEPVSPAEFIACDRAAETAFDMAVASLVAGQEVDPSSPEATSTGSRRPRATIKGGYR